MKRGGPLKRGKGLRRTPMPARRIPIPRRRVVSKFKDQGVSMGQLRAELLARCGGYCERGGCNLHQTGMEAHHRKLKSQQGQDSIVNLVALCPRHHRDHKVGVHFTRKAAIRDGFIVPSTRDPIAVPVKLHDGRTVHLTLAGGYAEHTTEGNQ